MAHLSIGFVRRGYSSSGGAEAYLTRLAAGIVALGHEARLITTGDWPATAWKFGSMSTLPGRPTPLRFADAVARMDLRCDVVLSLERLWRCDIYRAGDGVHRAWLERRAQFGGPLEKLGVALNRKHRAILRLEESLFSNDGADCVIANSQMVKDEICRIYNYPAERIAVIRNGLPVELFRAASEQRVSKRQELGLAAGDIAVLFAGSGWERKGLRFAIDAVESRGHSSMCLLVAGRGNPRKYRSRAAFFLGVVADMRSLYAAADIFLLPTLYDPFSNACLEALAAGLPVITTRANGFSEIIQDAIHGHALEDPTDLAAIALALEFWSDPARRAEARMRCGQLAGQFEISSNVARTLEILLAKAVL